MIEKKGNSVNLDHGYTDTHTDARTWSGLTTRDMTGGRNMRICTS